MIYNYTPEIEKPRRKMRLKQMNKSNRLARRYYADLRRREIPKGGK